MIRHHLSDKLLMAYAAGTLPEAFSLVVATHISICDECRARLAAFDSVGGAVLDQRVAPVAMSSDALSLTMAKIKSRAEPSPATPLPARDSVLPGPLRNYVGGGLDAVRWRSIGGGVRQAILPTSRNASARLLYIPAGTAVPDHGHRGLELTLVLQGAFVDETDRFARGDIEIADEALEHTPIAEAGMDCICLAATDAPLRFRALLPRLVQPFFRI
ncbi:ChrR family anti-sigma-E factor [Roseinatronobacter alkalisoli]|uniref:ChrR family anti-sigma-E factor n=1 Tax=Roseinatronobacter alkalisoli TaxID=3028235 RepID=A0ABT5TBT8_9RHOB|nr:ChrR family anti-sigma-E factor [Roseinatronobacter sp. HJB301]MDD7971388.1 ChrR family anti-sigma-E factor [Roseinatronobacter sp. HJB301]